MPPDFEEVFGLNAAYAEKVYGDYLNAPESVPAEWRSWFESALPPEQRATAVAKKPARSASAVTRTVGSEAKTQAKGAPSQGSGASEDLQPLTGVAGKIVKNMNESLSVPTATSTREIPAKVLEENRHAINRHQQGLYLPKVSFTHLIAWAMVRAMQKVPAMAAQFVEQDGKPFRRVSSSLNLGLAIDLPGKPSAGGDGRRSLVVPNIKDCGNLDFA
ncbi:MAG: 2-oxo acid dehydrogenase subunit E2, partial [Planctomycetota bacterium]